MRYHARRVRPVLLWLVLFLAVGLNGGCLVHTRDVTDVDELRGGWQRGAVYRLRHDMYLMRLEPWELEPHTRAIGVPVDLQPLRPPEKQATTSTTGGQPWRIYPPNPDDILGNLPAGTRFRFDRVEQTYSVWNGKHSAVGTILDGEFAGT